MASVPNMRLAPVTIVPGVSLPVIVDGAEFASLLPAAPDALPQPIPLMPAEAYAAAPAAEAEPEAIETIEPQAPSDAAQLAALLPAVPTAASPPAAAATETAAPPKAVTAPVAKAPARAAPAPLPVEPQAARAAPAPPETAKVQAPAVAARPADPETEDAPAETPPPAGKAVEAAKRMIEQALKPAAPLPAPGPPARVRPQNAPVEREAAPAIDTPPPLPATAPAPAPAPPAAPVTAPPAQAAEAPDRAVERALDLARDGEWLDRLARDIARTVEGDAPLRFRLHPQTLGHMRVELAQGDHGTSVRLTVETEAARAILADAQPRLAAEARAQGVRIAETHVDLSGSGDQRRQDETRQAPIIRTAREAASGGAAPAQPARARSDRYA